MLPMVVRVLILPKYWTERKKSSFKCIAWVALELGSFGNTMGGKTCTIIKIKTLIAIRIIFYWQKFTLHDQQVRSLLTNGSFLRCRRKFYTDLKI